MRLTQIEAEMQRLRQGYIKGILDEDEVTQSKNNLELEKTRLLNELNSDSKALNEAYFKTAKQFLETFKIIADKYKTATSEVKREVLNLFFSKRSYEDWKLVMKPFPIVQQVSEIANLRNGRGDRTWTCGLMVPNHVL